MGKTALIPAFLAVGALALTALPSNAAQPPSESELASAFRAASTRFPRTQRQARPCHSGVWALPADKADGLTGQYSRVLSRHEPQLSHELRSVEDKPEA